jgi:hypothetical protein
MTSVRSDSWQTVLRKQYMKRAPESNPFDPDPQSMSSNLIHSALIVSDTKATLPDAGPATKNILRVSPKNTATFINNATDCEKMPDESGLQHPNGEQHVAGDVVFKNWCELPMLVKLDSMYLLTEWQFQNPLRLRSIMKDDDEAACWVRHFDPIQQSILVSEHQRRSVLNPSARMPKIITIGSLEV